MDQLEQYWQFGAALIFVLALIGILFWVLQRIGFGGGKGRRGTRLGIVEAAVVDKKRRLVLIRRDAVEHLVMIGGPQDVVVENNITRREPSLVAGTNEPPRGGVIPELAVRAAERATPAAQSAAPEAKRPEPAPVEAATPPEPPQEKPLPHPDEPVRRAAPPVAVPEEPVRRAEPVASPPGDPVPRVETAASAAPDGPPRRAEPHVPGAGEPVRRIEPHGPLPDAVARRTEPQAIGPNRPPQPGDKPGQFRETPPATPLEASAPASQSRPWPPSEGRFREAQRRFAERSDIQPQTRGDRHQSAEEPEPARPPERPTAVAAEANGMSAPDGPREVSQQDGSPREPANLNLRPGEDR